MKLEYISTKNVVLLIGIAIIIGLISWFTPWLGDDIYYGFNILPEKKHQWISSIGEIFESQNSHWVRVNGRYVAHFFVQLFIGILGQPLFSIANGLAYIAFFIILSKIGDINLKESRTFCVLIAVSLVTFQTKYVPSCQIGYIWTFTLTIFFLYLFFKNNLRLKWWHLMLLSVFSVIAGNGQEALNIGISGALIVFWIFNMRKMSVAQYVMLISFGIGTLLNCLSPGIIGRAGKSHATLIFSLFNFLCYCKAFYLLVIIVIWQRFKLKKSFKCIYESNEFYWNAWLILLLFNFIIVVANNRQLFGFELISIIISFRLLSSTKIKNLWIYLIWVYAIFIYTIVGICDIQTYKQWEDIKKQYSKSETGIIYTNLGTLISDGDIGMFLWCDKINYKMSFEGISWIDHNNSKYLHHFYPGKPDCVVVSSFLKNKEKCNLRNQIIPLDFGVYMIIQNKHNPKNPVLQGFSRYGIHNDTTSERIDMHKDIVMETPHWKAKQYQIPTLSRITPTKLMVEFE